MTPLDDLFLLIKSLTKNEKGHFKKYASKHIVGNQNSYMKIFDAIAAQKKYDEQALKKQFTNETFLSGFATYKVYLYDLILKSLSVFHADKSVESELLRVLLNTEILFKKGLFLQAYKPLSKAKKLAYEHELYVLVLSFLDWQKRLLTNGSLVRKFGQDLNMIINEKADVINKIQNINQYDNLAIECNQIALSKDTARNNEELRIIKKIITNPLLVDEKKALSNTAKFTLYSLCSYLNYEAGELHESYNYCKKNIELHESSAVLISQNLMRYLAALQNLQVLETKLKKYKNVLMTLEKSRQIAAKYGHSIKNIELRVFEWTYSSELLILITTGEFEKALFVSKTILEKLNQYGDDLNKHSELFLKYYIAYLFFILKRHQESHELIRSVLNDSKLDLGQDIISFALILNLLLCYERDNAILLEHFGKSASRFLKKKNRLYNVESLLLNFFYKKLANLHKNDPKEANIFKQLKNELLEILKDPLEQKTLKYLNIIAWIDSKIEKKDFAVLLKKQSI